MRFAAGLILSNSKHVHELTALTEPIVALFATLFFVMIGTGFDFSVINPLNPDNRSGLVMAGFLLIVAILGKVATGWAYWDREKTNRLAVGLGMMPRGEVGLVFLALGGSTQVLSDNLEGGNSSDGDWHHLPGAPAAAPGAPRHERMVIPSW